ncbi:DNA recombination protein RmuC [Hyphomonas sp.]|uniref:DNA recombination protein RmuC n=1 Tax=Hyphomonas sp. TaxID=87 RepID=UPI00391AC037
MSPVITIGSAGLDMVHVLLLLIAVVLAAFVWTTRQRTALERAELDRLRQREQTLEAVARDAELKLAASEARSAEDERKFAQMAQGVLAQANEQFLQLANETFTRHKEGTQSQISELVKPIGLSLEEFAKRVGELEKVRVEDKSALQTQVLAIGESLQRNTQETNKLVTALSAPKGGGRWGEMTLRNVMEQAGLSEHCDFSEQVHDQTAAGRQRPDAVIRLPGDRQIVVDSKVSLDAYLAAHAAADPAQIEAHLKAHASSVQRHVQTLSSKDYQSNLGNRFDYVVMFIPGENFFAEALKHAPDLIEKAMNRSVIVTTPTTLIALARTVAHLWRQHHQNENAKAAAEEAMTLYTRIGKVLEHMDKLGKQLNGSVDAYNKMVGSVETRVLPSLRKMESLKITSEDAAPDDPQRLDKRASEVRRAPELGYTGPGDVAAE